jgi:hypothetical protein
MTIEYRDGNTYYYNEDHVLHREDGPAITHADGTFFWILNGLNHRVGAPAVKFTNGSEWWYLNGRLHREDGPAIIASSGKSYYLNGKYINVNSNKEFLQYKKLIAFQ